MFSSYVCYSANQCGFLGTPYPGFSNQEVIELIKKNRRLAAPLEMPDDLRPIFSSCLKDANERPTFGEINQFLSKKLEEHLEPVEELHGRERAPRILTDTEDNYHDPQDVVEENQQLKRQIQELTKIIKEQQLLLDQMNQITLPQTNQTTLSQSNLSVRLSIDHTKRKPGLMDTVTHSISKMNSMLSASMDKAPVSGQSGKKQKKSTIMSSSDPEQTITEIEKMISCLKDSTLKETSLAPTEDSITNSADTNSSKELPVLLSDTNSSKPSPVSLSDTNSSKALSVSLSGTNSSKESPASLSSPHPEKDCIPKVYPIKFLRPHPVTRCGSVLIHRNDSSTNND